MRQEQFKNRFVQSGQSQSEIDRKWRLHLEKEHYDQIVEAQQYNVNNAPVSPGAGGSRQVGERTTYYGNLIPGMTPPTSDDYKLAVLNTDGTYTAINLLNYEFYGPTSFTAYPYDTDFMWFVSYDSDAEELIWGNIEMSTGVVTEVLRGFASGLQEGPPGPLWHAGEDTFYFLTNGVFFNDPINAEVWALTIGGQAYYAYDVATTQFTPFQFFTYTTVEYPYAIWAVVSAPEGDPQMYLTRLAPDPGNVLVIDQEPILMTINGTPQGPSKITVCVGVKINEENEIIVSLIYGPVETSESYGCIASMDLNGVCTYIQDLGTVDGSSLFLNGLAIYPNENIQ